MAARHFGDSLLQDRFKQGRLVRIEQFAAGTELAAEQLLQVVFQLLDPPQVEHCLPKGGVLLAGIFARLHQAPFTAGAIVSRLLAHQLASVAWSWLQVLEFVSSGL